MLEELFLDGVLVEPGDGAQPPGERTLLARRRTALGTSAVAVAIGSILPKLARLPGAGHM
jgi:uncharacterized membrane protein YidH (DUF202 family)